MTQIEPSHIQQGAENWARSDIGCSDEACVKLEI